MTEIDPRMYGGTGMPPELRVEPVQPTVPEVPAAAGNPEAVPAATAFAGLDAAEQSAAQREANARERAGILESIGAGFTLTDTASIYARLTAPAFVPEPEFDMVTHLQQVPMQLSKDDLEFMQKSESQSEWDWRLQRVRDLRMAGEAAGDTFGATFLTGVLDPVYLGLGGAALATARAARAGLAARAVTAGVEGAGAYGVGVAAQQGSPKSDTDVLVGALLNGAATAVLYRGGAVRKQDPDFPDQALNQTAREVAQPPAQAAVPDAPPANTVAEVEAQVQTRTQRLGKALEWNMHKEMSKFGAAGKKIADLLFDDNADLAKGSVESEWRGVRSSLSTQQRVFEDDVVKALAEDGYGVLGRIFKPREARAAQQALMQEVQEELWRRDQLNRLGRPVSFEGVSPRVKRLADTHDRLTADALREMKAAGVKGAEEVAERSGWSTRRWDSANIDDAIRRFEQSGMDNLKATRQVSRLVASALRRANGWDEQLSFDVGSAIVYRALRKGTFEDAPFRTHQGNEVLAEMRDVLKAEGMTPERIDRALAILEGRNADVGMPSFLKGRVELDYRSAVRMPDGSLLRVTDLIDKDLITNTERYLDGVASQVAWARKGLPDRNSIDALRNELMRDIPDTASREKARELFDNTFAYLSGRPAGQRVNDSFRAMQQVGRMMSLSNSGLWQVTEYATILGRYGALRTTRAMIRTMPGFRELFQGADRRTSTQLADILTRQSSQDVRIRPYISRFEDNFEMPAGAAVQLSLQQSAQLVPYINAMKYVHHHQAVLSANLITERLADAARGNAKARAALQKYGISPHVMDNLARDVREFGTDTARWSDDTWAQVRPAFAKMMDEAVLHARLGDTPSFAKYDQVGKFIFTYRSFMLTAHNKLLAGSLGREGAAGLSMLLLYQLPLAAMAVKAQQASQGKDIPDDELWDAALGQMGGLGLFSELYGVAFGDRREFGAPGLIPIDRVYGTVNDLTSGNVGKAGFGALEAIPLLGLLQPIKALQTLAEE